MWPVLLEILRRQQLKQYLRQLLKIVLNNMNFNIFGVHIH